MTITLLSSACTKHPLNRESRFYFGIVQFVSSHYCLLLTLSNSQFGESFLTGNGNREGCWTSNAYHPWPCTYWLRVLITPNQAHDVASRLETSTLLGPSMHPGRVTQTWHSTHIHCWTRFIYPHLIPSNTRRLIPSLDPQFWSYSCNCPFIHCHSTVFAQNCCGETNNNLGQVSFPLCSAVAAALFIVWWDIAAVNWSFHQLPRSWCLFSSCLAQISTQRFPSTFRDFIAFSLFSHCCVCYAMFHMFNFS